MDFPYILNNCATSGNTGSRRKLLIDAANSFLAGCGLLQDAETSSKGTFGLSRLTIDFSLLDVSGLVATHEHIDHARSPSFKELIIRRNPQDLHGEGGSGRGVAMTVQSDSKVVNSKVGKKQSKLDWTILDSIPSGCRLTQVYRELDCFWGSEVPSPFKSWCNPLAVLNLIAVDYHRSHQTTLNRLAQTAQFAIVMAGNGMCFRVVSSTTSRPCWGMSI
ncbi:hypothetical protein N1078_18020 [Pseudomonas sp. MIL19]|uniref:hypothetical protein n=1 Tax=Pseudomonas sp. MIL19 TaxID=2976979 RepID=UPI0023640A5F|nr:hypothetical protein [Pseudomonas sp. MIL19]MDD2162466.1 hypothetical protein [Pseudomonas sp. MIL19]